MAEQMIRYLDMDGIAYFYDRIQGIFVKLQEGMGLSENNFTNELKTKLTDIQPDNYLSDSDALSNEEIDEIINTVNQQIDE